jgi:hypothetical protein
MIFEGFPGRTQAESTHPGEGNGIVPGPRGHSKIKDTSLQFAGFFNQIPDWQTADWQFQTGGQEKQIIAEWITENS